MNQYTALLYLNPELSAYSNVRTIEDVQRDWGAYGSLPHHMLPLPFGFDARVYLAAQPDVSTLNETIRLAMLAEGLADGAVKRRGTYVGTLMEPVDALGSNTFALQPSSPVAFSACNLRLGDDVRLLRDRGDPLSGVVVGLTERSFTLCNPVCSFPAAQQYTVFGIKVWDPERQARVAYARNAPSPGAAPPTNEDNLPDATFDKQVYQAVYPEARAFAFGDAYLDYRSRWNRGREYRIIKGRDIFNLRAPYGSNVAGAAGTSALLTGVAATSNFVALHSNLTVTPTDASLRSGITVAGSNVVVSSTSVVVGGPAAEDLVVDSSLGVSRVHGSNLVVTRDGTVSMCDGFVRVSNTSNSATAGAAVGLSVGDVGELQQDALLRVGGDIFTTGTVVTQSDVRAKRELRAIDGALERVRRLQGYTYVAAADPSGRRHTGLLAQDVADVLPEAVYGDAVTGSSVAYGNLAGLLVEAIKALSDRVDRLSGATADS
jgi:hypothetical protein